MIHEKQSLAEELADLGPKLGQKVFGLFRYVRRSLPSEHCDVDHLDFSFQVHRVSVSFLEVASDQQVRFEMLDQPASSFNGSSCTKNVGSVQGTPEHSQELSIIVSDQNLLLGHRALLVESN